MGNDNFKKDVKEIFNDSMIHIPDKEYCIKVSLRKHKRKPVVIAFKQTA